MTDSPWPTIHAERLSLLDDPVALGAARHLGHGHVSR